ncbi:glycosyltransferase family 47 protein [Atractiella rhizophila]|nr:glycosyltransferase family 47 protein [Atractiella rhizophila]
MYPSPRLLSTQKPVFRLLIYASLLLIALNGLYFFSLRSSPRDYQRLRSAVLGSPSGVKEDVVKDGDGDVGGAAWFVSAKEWVGMDSEQRHAWRERMASSVFDLPLLSSAPGSREGAITILLPSSSRLPSETASVLPYLLSSLLSTFSNSKPTITVACAPEEVQGTMALVRSFFTSPLSSTLPTDVNANDPGWSAGGFRGALEGQLERLRFVGYEEVEDEEGGVIDFGFGYTYRSSMVKASKLTSPRWILRLSSASSINSTDLFSSNSKGEEGHNGPQPTTLSLALSNTDDNLNFLLPSLFSLSKNANAIDLQIQRAISGLSIHYDTLLPPTLQIIDARDAASAISQAVFLLQASPQALGDLSSREKGERGERRMEVVVGGVKTVERREVVDAILKITSSRAPVGWLHGTQVKGEQTDGGWWDWFSTPLRSSSPSSPSSSFSSSGYGYTLMETLSAHLLRLLLAHQTHLDRSMSISCPSVSLTPSSISHTLLTDLSGGTFQLLYLDGPEGGKGGDGTWYSLSCGGERGEEWIRLERAMGYREPLRFVGGVVRRSESGNGGEVGGGEEGGAVEMKFKCGERWMAWGGVEQGFVPARVGEWFEIGGWDGMERSFGLRRKVGPVDGEEGEWLQWDKEVGLRFGRVEERASWRVNPVCLKEAGGGGESGRWDLWKDDPLTISQVLSPPTDGKYNLSRSSSAYMECKQATEESAVVELMLERAIGSNYWASFLEGDLDDDEGEEEDGSLLNPNTENVVRSENYEDWISSPMKICHVHCDAPIPCLPTSTCRCPLYSCPSIPTSPSRFIASGIDGSLSLPSRVSHISWEDVVLPSSLEAFTITLRELPTIHVVLVHEDGTVDRHWENEACYKIDKADLPSMGDHFFVRSLLAAQSSGKISQPSIGEADAILLPYYHGCYSNYMHIDNGQNLRATVDFYRRYLQSLGHDPKENRWWNRLLVPFAHDFGECVGWSATLEGSWNWKRGYPMEEAMSWQPNGDLNTPCFKAGRDIVAPGTSKHVPDLLKIVGGKEGLRKVKPVERRKYLAFFHGGTRGFGSLVRNRIGCANGADDNDVLYQDYGEGMDYVQTLGESKFCLLPRGVQAWTTRTYEAMYAGCIPVFLADRNLPPFHDIFDWTTFSINIPETSAHRYVDILRAIEPLRTMELQAALLKVREYFVFYGENEFERDEGPLRATLVDLKLRLGLKYPS